jgi:hypothetical protein
VDNLVRGQTIPAAICSSDFARRAEFDASRWFLEAPAQTILELAHSAWQSERLAHEVAICALGSDDSVADVLQYVMYLRHGGLRAECRLSVAADAALKWLAVYRPDVAAALLYAA